MRVQGVECLHRGIGGDRNRAIDAGQEEMGRRSRPIEMHLICLERLREFLGCCWGGIGRDLYEHIVLYRAYKQTTFLVLSL